MSARTLTALLMGDPDPNRHEISEAIKATRPLRSLRQIPRPAFALLGNKRQDPEEEE